VERAGEGEDLGAVLAALVPVLPGHLDREFSRFGAGIREEHRLGEGRRHERFGERLLAGDLVEIGDVPELAGLFRQRLDECGMGMAEHVDGDARPEVEVALAARGFEPGALAGLEGERGAGIGGEDGWYHGSGLSTRTETGRTFAVRGEPGSAAASSVPKSMSHRADVASRPRCCKNKRPPMGGGVSRPGSRPAPERRARRLHFDRGVFADADRARADVDGNDNAATDDAGGDGPHGSHVPPVAAGP